MQKPTKHKRAFSHFFEVHARDCKYLCCERCVNRSIFAEYSKILREMGYCICLRSIVVVRSLRKRKVASSILAEGL